MTEKTDVGVIEDGPEIDMDEWADTFAALRDADETFTAARDAIKAFAAPTSEAIASLKPHTVRLDECVDQMIAGVQRCERDLGPKWRRHYMAWLKREQAKKKEHAN